LRALTESVSGGLPALLFPVNSMPEAATAVSLKDTGLYVEAPPNFWKQGTKYEQVGRRASSAGRTN
jgi:hypothetical protein